MTSRRDRWQRKAIAWSGIAVLLVSLQYVVVSNVTFVSVAPTSRQPMIPLPGWAQRLASRCSVVVCQPMRSAMVHSAKTSGAGVTGEVTRAVLRFKTTVANDVSFAVVNGLIWFCVVMLIVGVSGCVRRWSTSRERETSVSG